MLAAALEVVVGVVAVCRRGRGARRRRLARDLVRRSTASSRRRMRGQPGRSRGFGSRSRASCRTAAASPKRTMPRQRGERLGGQLVQREVLVAPAEQQHDRLCKGAEAGQRALRGRGDGVVVVLRAVDLARRTPGGGGRRGRRRRRWRWRRGSRRRRARWQRRRRVLRVVAAAQRARCPARRAAPRGRRSRAMATPSRTKTPSPGSSAPMLNQRTRPFADVRLQRARLRVVIAEHGDVVRRLVADEVAPSSVL